MKSAVSSLYQAVDLQQEIPPLLIGERCNANGSKRFRELLLADDFEGCVGMALEQQAQGAQILDLCVAYAGRDELMDMTCMVSRFAKSVKAALMIDSTTPAVIEASLKLYPGRCIINSINLEDGGTNLHRICTLAKRYGAAVVALTIHEKGMAMTMEEKVQTARRIYDLAVHEHGLRARDLLFDALTFTIGSGDESLKEAAIATLEAIQQIKEQLSDVFTVLGVSNVSFGLRPAARRVLNSVFLHEAVEAGLDVAIMDIAKVLPFAQINQVERDLALDLIYNRRSKGSDSPLMAIIDHYETATQDIPSTEAQTEQVVAETVLSQKVLKGDKEGLEDVLSILIRRYPALEIINDILIPAMRNVGELFGRGELLLPFVLQSAEVMKQAVTWLEPYMERAEADQSIKVLLATVQGDVHDIGKNLVDIILSNNGYTVYNLGIKVPAEVIIQEARERQVDMIGLSGLLVKSAMVMQESMPQYRADGLDIPILVGGAALTRKFVATSCVPLYNGPVVYCADAFAGLKAVQDFEMGHLENTHVESTDTTPRQVSSTGSQDIRFDTPIPEPPFIGLRHITDIDVGPLFEYVNEQALFRGRWGYRRGKLSAEEYQGLVQTKVVPIYEALKRRSLDEALLEPKVAYGYFRCWSQGNALCVSYNDQVHTMGFPRQASPPHLCIADYFRTREQGGDVVGFFVATIGEPIGQEARRLYENDQYHDYLMLHGFGVEVTDALAEYWHEVMRNEWGIGQVKPKAMTGYVTQQYQGSRYGFGYPACPDLGIHETLWQLLQPYRIGVSLTESMEMVPEQSTSAIVVHHPQAKYFSI